jgi:Domain of unknown function (DUF4190)
VADGGVSAPPARPGGTGGPLQLCTCCREPLAPGTDVCPRCNTDVRGGPRSAAARQSLVLGLIGLGLVPIVFSVPAIVLAVRARREVERNPGMHGREAAGWGLATGIVGTALGVALMFMVLIGWLAPQ